MKTTDLPATETQIIPVTQLVLFSDQNDWCSGTGPGSYRWVTVPHAKNGPVKRNNSIFIYPSEGQTAQQMGAVGGNVGLIDGSVSWKRIEAMYPNFWTYSLDALHRGAW